MSAEQASMVLAAWLIDNGSLPPVGKANIKLGKLENQLFNKMQTAQAGVEAEMQRQLAALARLPSTSRGRRKLINRVLGEMMGTIPGIIADGAVEAAHAGAEAAALELAALGHEVTFELLEPAAAQRLSEKVYTFSQDTMGRIQGTFAKTLDGAYREGLGIDEAARVLRADFTSFRHHRLEAIARTEIQGAQNWAADQVMRNFGAQYKQWITVGDDRVRGAEEHDEYDHIHLHGQVMEIDEEFSNGLMTPGDQSGPLGEFINCRCRQRPYIPRPDEKITATPYYP